MRRLALLLVFCVQALTGHAQRADIAVRTGIDVLKQARGNDEAINAAIADNFILPTLSLSVAYRTKHHWRFGVVADYRRAPYNYSYWTTDSKNYPTKVDVKGTSAFLPVRAFVTRTFTIKALEPYLGISGGAIINPGDVSIFYPRTAKDSYPAYKNTAGYCYGWHIGYTTYLSKTTGFGQELTWTTNQVNVSDSSHARFDTWSILVSVRFRI